MSFEEMLPCPKCETGAVEPVRRPIGFGYKWDRMHCQQCGKRWPIGDNEEEEEAQAAWVDLYDIFVSKIGKDTDMEKL